MLTPVAELGEFTRELTVGLESGHVFTGATVYFEEMGLGVKLDFLTPYDALASVIQVKPDQEASKQGYELGEKVRLIFGEIAGDCEMPPPYLPG